MKIIGIIFLLLLICIPYGNAVLAQTWCKGLSYGNACFNGSTGENVLTGLKLNWTDLLNVPSGVVNISQKANIGDCPNGYAIQNATSIGVQCVQVSLNPVAGVGSAGVIPIWNSSGTLIDSYLTTNINTTIRPSGMFLPSRYIALDSVKDEDSGFVFGYNGLPVWDVSTFVNESAKYLHIGINYRSGDTTLLLSETGQIAINRPSSIMNYHHGLNGTGPDNLIISGTYTGALTDLFEIQVTNTSTYKWRVNIHNLEWSAFSSVINMTTIPQLLYKGIMVQFTNITNNNVNDTYYFTAWAPNPASTFGVRPTSYQEVVYYNGTAYQKDITFEASTSNGIPFDFPNKTGQYLYVARHIPTFSTNVVLQTPGVGITLKLEYYNNSDWVTITPGTNTLIDLTYNMTKTGSLEWDANTLVNWSSNVSVDDYTSVNDYYWLRYSTTTNATTTAKLYAISPQGYPRLRVFQSAGDLMPIFTIAPNGNTEISGTLLANGFYAELYNTTTSTITLTTQSAWYNVSNMNTGELSGWITTQGYILNCTQSGLYQVTYSINGAANNNDVYNYRVLINNIVELKGDATMRYSSGQSDQVVSTFLKRFNTYDNIILQIRDTSRANGQFTYDNRNILLTRIGN